MDKRRTILAGGSGFLGKCLAEELTAHGYEVIVLSRNPQGPSQLHWDGKTAGAWARELEGAYAVVNLTGKNVNCRYTPANRREIVVSRVDSVHALGRVIAACKDPPKVWVQTSSLAIYGDTHDRWCEEDAPCGVGFPVETCQLWEEALRSENTPRTRKVVLRIGFVLDAGRGALATLEKLVRCFLGGRVGSGRQYISWIHWHDMNEMFRWVLERDGLEGVFNATSPEPVTNAEFMTALRKSLHRPWSPPAPKFAIHLGAFVMRTEPMLALTGRRCAPKRFLDKGFPFKFPKLENALRDLYK